MQGQQAEAMIRRPVLKSSVVFNYMATFKVPAGHSTPCSFLSSESDSSSK